MELTEDLKGVLVATAKQLKGNVRRLFMARMVKALGAGGASRAESELGWKRKTIRKGTHELESGMTCLDAFGTRGRKRAEDHLPNLLPDSRAIVDGQSQTDPQFKTNRLYTRLTAPQVRRQLIEKFGYTDQELPTATTFRTKLNERGSHPMKVAQSANPKKAPSSRCHLRAGKRGQGGSRCRPESATPFHRYQSCREGWELLARRQEARAGQSS